ncbi:2-amino-4-hydroxy-6-hydroxymethyldihydropteridine diphosphokinase [uncultured Draconibacterium sp.]|uniref:2-amino-4-hydroxy-6- hydroxymethyldihydropteridine diphosphokinase n=1 Tax=uncultured Draconibacterium sp. TaxID=1573823 RepID=UPI0025F2BE6F|nr:2-amino-4-hydroxy-6-hydroxymethyldihydropteridine diphosphokinase [uncultured Draconibacterium sp.]
MDIQPGFYYHIYNRGNNSSQIFFKEENYFFFLTKMKEHLLPYVSVVAWCLMPNHFHWVVYVHNLTISDTLTLSEDITKTKNRTLNQSIGILLRSYTRAIQKQEGISGSLFQKHTKAKVLIDEVVIEPAYWDTAFGTKVNLFEGKTYLEACVQYVHNNPVYSQLVRKVEDWKFSSARDYLGMRKGQIIDYELINNEGLIDTLTSSESINIVIVGIGSNINADENIAKMLEILKGEVDVLQVSTMIKTKPIGIEDQPDYTNGAVKISTDLEQTDLKKMLKQIEDRMGRDRTGPKFGPRCIDLDIAVWNGEVVDEDYYTRDFLRKSVQELGGVTKK